VKLQAPRRQSGGRSRKIFRGSPDPHRGQGRSFRDQARWWAGVQQEGPGAFPRQRGRGHRCSSRGRRL